MILGNTAEIRPRYLQNTNIPKCSALTSAIGPHMMLAVNPKPYNNQISKHSYCQGTSCVQRWLILTTVEYPFFFLNMSNYTRERPCNVNWNGWRRQDRLCGLVVGVPGYRSRGLGSIRFPALPDFLRSSEFGTRSTQSRECTWGATCKTN
jgi:hypothetical protein